MINQLNKFAPHAPNRNQWHWGQDQERVFDELKGRPLHVYMLTSSPATLANLALFEPH